MYIGQNAVLYNLNGGALYLNGGVENDEIKCFKAIKIS